MPACKTKHRSTACAPFRVRGGRAVRTRATGAPQVLGKADSHETDVVVIGAGIGGLSCAALLAKYGLQVTVLESHTILGGAAHVRCQALLHYNACAQLACSRGAAWQLVCQSAVAALPMYNTLQTKATFVWLCSFRCASHRRTATCLSLQALLCRGRAARLQMHHVCDSGMHH